MSFFNSLQPREKPHRTFGQTFTKWVAIWVILLVTLWFATKFIGNLQKQTWIVETKVASACDLGHLEVGDKVIFRGREKSVNALNEWSWMTEIEISK